MLFVCAATATTALTRSADATNTVFNMGPPKRDIVRGALVQPHCQVRVRAIPRLEWPAGVPGCGQVTAHRRAMTAGCGALANPDDAVVSIAVFDARRDHGSVTEGM